MCDGVLGLKQCRRPIQFQCNQIHHPKTNTFRRHCLLDLVLLAGVLVVLFHHCSDCDFLLVLLSVVLVCCLPPSAGR